MTWFERYAWGDMIINWEGENGDSVVKDGKEERLISKEGVRASTSQAEGHGFEPASTESIEGPCGIAK